MSNWPLARSISSDTLPLSLLLVSLRLSPRTSLSVTLSMPSSRTLARIAPATSPTPVTARACSRSGTRIGQGDSRAAPFGPNIDEAGAVERDLRAGQPIGVIGAAERTVERPHKPHVAPAHIGEQRRRSKQVDAHSQRYDIRSRQGRLHRAPPPAATASTAALVRRAVGPRASPSPRRRSAGWPAAAGGP